MVIVCDANYVYYYCDAKHNTCSVMPTGLTEEEERTSVMVVVRHTPPSEVPVSYVRTCTCMCMYICMQKQNKSDRCMAMHVPLIEYIN